MFDNFVCLQDIKYPFHIPKDNVKFSKSNDVVSCENRICSFYRLLNFCISVGDMLFWWGHALFTTTRDLKNITGYHTLFGLNGDSTKFSKNSQPW